LLLSPFLAARPDLSRPRASAPHSSRFPAAALLVAALSACATLEGTHRDAQRMLNDKTAAMDAPHALANRYTTALERFGKMLDVYRGKSAPLYVQTRSILDSTGLSHPLVGAELPADITEMVRSAINRIGDHVVYVPFQPEYVLANAQLGATVHVTLPDVLITGAITEFDRALSSVGKGNDISVLFGKGTGETDAAASQKYATTLSTLTIDFNLVDFGKQVMLPRMQAANSMRVLNQTSDRAFDFAIYGNGFGFSSNTRYLQGRHNAIRVLVDLSVLQLLGRYTNVPYWRAIPNASPDPVVLQKIEKSYETKDKATKVKWLQDTLKDYGFPIQATGVLDDNTRFALDAVIAKFGFTRRADYLDSRLFLNLYLNIPLDRPPVARP
jgi:hypothetical protein